MKKVLAAATLGTLVLLSGCASLISATRDTPIQNDPGHRMFGNYVEDEIIETKALVNISKGTPELRDSHVGVTSYNGLVLLTGQVPNTSTREEAERIVGAIEGVRKVDNELQISGPTSSIMRTNDVYLTSRVKLELLADKNVPGSRIKVVTENGTVFLMGLVSKDEADRTVSVVRGIPGVQKIVKVFEYI